MAYYRLSTFLKMKRNAIGVARDAFDAEGPSDMTVYRMEKGKQYSNKTYNLLTNCMGVEENLKENILNVESFSDIFLLGDMQRSLSRMEYADSMTILEHLFEKIDISDKKNQQKFLYLTLIIKFHHGKISLEEYLNGIYELLYLRIPKDYSVNLYEWPFHVDELQMLISLDGILQGLGKYKEQLDNARGIMRLMQMRYVVSDKRNQYTMFAFLFEARAYGNMGEYEKALEIDHENLLFCENNQEFSDIAEIYYDIHWNYWELKKKRPLSSEEEKECKRALFMAYYIAKSRKYKKPLYEKRLLERYSDEIE